MDKLEIIKKATVPHFNLDRYFSNASQVLALTSIRRCFKIFASASLFYYSFGDMRSFPPFPVRERVILERGSIFNPWATFSNYLGYIREVCFFFFCFCFFFFFFLFFFFFQEPLTWDAASVKNTIAALKLQGGGKYRFRNFIRGDIAARIPIRRSMDIPFHS